MPNVTFSNSVTCNSNVAREIESEREGQREAYLICEYIKLNLNWVSPSAEASRCARLIADIALKYLYLYYCLARHTWRMRYMRPHLLFVDIRVCKHTPCVSVCMINNNQEDSSRAGFMLSFERSHTHTHTLRHTPPPFAAYAIYIHNVALCSRCYSRLLCGCLTATKSCC